MEYPFNSESSSDSFSSFESIIRNFLDKNLNCSLEMVLFLFLLVLLEIFSLLISDFELLFLDILFLKSIFLTYSFSLRKLLFLISNEFSNLFLSVSIFKLFLLLYVNLISFFFCYFVDNLNHNFDFLILINNHFSFQLLHF